MRFIPIADDQVWEEGRRCVLAPPDGDPTGNIRPLEVVIDTVSVGGMAVPRFNTCIELDPGDLEALAENPRLWVSTLGVDFRPIAAGLLPEGVDLARRG